MLPLTAVERMSDGTGILQHGIHNIADRRHGYCIDDNARALILAVRRGRDDPEGTLAALASTYSAFLQHGWNEDRARFRNFMSYERIWLEPVGSEDSNGRTLWALGITAARSPWSGIREWAKTLFEHSGRTMGDPRCLPRPRVRGARRSRRARSHSRPRPRARDGPRRRASA